MGKYQTLAKNSVFVLIGNIGSKAISFLMLPFYTSYLSVEDYGTAELIGVYVSLILPVVTCSIYNSVLVFPVNRDKETQSSYFSSGLVFTFLMLGITAFVFAGLGLAFPSKTDSFFTYKWLIFINIVISFLQSYFQQFCMALNKMFVFSFSGILLTLSIALFGIFIIPQYGLIGYIQSLIAAHFVTALFTFVVTKLHKYVKLSLLSRDKLREMLVYSVPLIPNALMWWIIGALNKVTMETYIGVYFIGLYAVADKIPGILSALFNSVANAWKVSVLEEYGKRDFSYFYNNVAKVVITTVAFGVAFFGLLSEPIIKLATQENFHAAWIYSPIMVFGFMFQSIGGVVDTIFSAEKKGSYFFYSSIVGAAVCVLFNLLLIPKLGIWGAIGSFICSHFCMALVRWILAEKFVVVDSKKTIFGFILLVIICNVLHSIFHNYLVTGSLFVIISFLYYSINKEKIKILYKSLLSKIRK